MARAKGYIENYNPQAKTRRLFEAVKNVIDQYNYPLTLRQVYYRLVGLGRISKTVKEYERLTYHVSNARRAREIPFEAIRDDSVIERETDYGYSSITEFVDNLQWNALRLRLTRHATQKVYVEVLCESGGMVPQLVAVTKDYGIAVRSAGGFDSLTAKRHLVNRIAKAGKPTYVLHLGDHDPSGKTIFDVLEQDVTAFLAVDAPGAVVDFRRVALTGAQVTAHNLPTSPFDGKSSHGQGWTGGTCQLEAMDPDAIQKLLRKEIEALVNVQVISGRRVGENAFNNKFLPMYQDKMWELVRECRRKPGMA